MQRIINYYVQLWPLQSLQQGFSSKFGKRPLAKIGKKNINLTAKLGEINDIEHNRVAKYILKSKLF